VFRLKLIIAFSVLLFIVLLLTATLYWGVQRTEYYFQRSQLAHDSSEAYVQLSHDAYRHFKELVDIAVLDGDASVEQAKLSYQKLQQSFAQLQFTISAEISYVDEEELAGENQEMAQVMEIKALLTDGMLAFERINTLQRDGAEQSAHKVLESVLEQTIDKKFKPIIDTLIVEEREELEKSRWQVQQIFHDLKRITTIASITAFFLALAMVIWLLHNLNISLSRLIKGVQHVTQNDLTHRIALSGKNEFSYLAEKFNNMTQQLAEQREFLLSAQVELECKVEIRTRELLEANEKLKHIDKGRLRFFADISHELRTPLTAIRGEAEVTARGEDKTATEYQKSLKLIVGFSEQLGKLVEDLIFMVRTKSDHLRFEFSRLILNNLISHVCEDFRLFAQQRQLQFRLELPEKDIHIFGDQQRLQQMLLILIDNACHYSNPGGDIIIALHVEKKHTILTIHNQGIEIAEKELGNVFKRFYRGTQARKKVPSGTGLGLPLAKSIIEAHDGTIKIFNAENQGTRLVISLPVLRIM